jgi:tetratricopeptide (TPR) repeat protein
MILRKAWKAVLLAAGLAALATSGCSRDHIEAINLANEGDRSVEVNVEGAIQKYEQAKQLDPTNHRILWKLAKAYEKKEDWDRMATTLSVASQQAPEFANYFFKRGYALIKMAEAGNRDRYEEAKAPLAKCVQADPNFGECYHFLGEACLWTDDEQCALENYTKAIEHDPRKPYYYPSLAELYIVLKLYAEAETVLTEGTRIIPPTEETRNHLYAMFVLLIQVAQAKDDKASMLVAAENAKKVGGDAHPEISFILGSTYAILDPPKTEKAARLLKSFQNKACKSAKAAQFKEQCETSQSLIQKLGAAGN